MARTLTVVLLAAVCVVQAAPAARAEPAADGKISMVNNTSSLTVNLYIDGQYIGTAFGGFPCTAEVTAGIHFLEATTSDGRTASRKLDVEAGSEYTWTISDK